MRQFIRHPSAIPIEFDIASLVNAGTEYLNDISNAGLSFRARRAVPIGSTIMIRIPLIRPHFAARGQVVWCRRGGLGYDIGVSFLSQQEAFDTRMVEQVCHIEQYKREVLKLEGRRLTSEQAAIEWIKKYAASFPAVV